MRQVNGTKFAARVVKDEAHVMGRLQQTWLALNARDARGGDTARAQDRYERRSFLFLALTDHRTV